MLGSNVAVGDKQGSGNGTFLLSWLLPNKGLRVR